MRTVGVLALFAALAASCSLVTDLSSLDGDAGDAGDGGVDGGDGSATDAIANDVQPTDASVSCPGYPLAFLCDDFADGWSPVWTKNEYGGASVSISGEQAVSPPTALLSQTPDAPDSGGSVLEYGAGLVYPRNGIATKHVRSSYDIYLDQVGDRSAAIGGVYLGTSMSTQYYGVVLYVNANGNKLIEDGLGDLSDGGGTSNAAASGFAIPLRTWTRIVLDVDFAAGTVSLAETDPATPPDASLPFVVAPTPIHPTLAGPSTFVFAGISYQTANPGQSNATRVFVDDVVFESL
ncbi:MAG TPA: hypothetical protein VGH28_14950 [Polyangiaceae bacterium]|jgi:hypothetical protein